MAIFLRSGDAVVMGGEARHCVHGVPRIITGSFKLPGHGEAEVAAVAAPVALLAAAAGVEATKAEADAADIIVDAARVETVREGGQVEHGEIERKQEEELLDCGKKIECACDTLPDVPVRGHTYNMHVHAHDTHPYRPHHTMHSISLTIS